MERGVTNLLIGQGYSKKAIGISFLIVFIALILFASYFFFYYRRPCGTSGCFSEAGLSCKKVFWIREDAQASWYYEINGKSGDDNCKVGVKILKMKQGTIESEKLEGKEMDCIVDRRELTSPESDMAKCSGPLKEELQDIIIQRMHDYLLQNIGEIEEEFSEF
jgi:hypothetical protein